MLSTFINFEHKREVKGAGKASFNGNNQGITRNNSENKTLNPGKSPINLRFLIKSGYSCSFKVLSLFFNPEINVRNRGQEPREVYITDINGREGGMVGRGTSLPTHHTHHGTPAAILPVYTFLLHPGYTQPVYSSCSGQRAGMRGAQ